MVVVVVVLVELLVVAAALEEPHPLPASRAPETVIDRRMAVARRLVAAIGLRNRSEFMFVFLLPFFVIPFVRCRTIA